MKLTATRARALAAVLTAALGASLTQPDVLIPPPLKLVILVVLAGLAAADWGAIVEDQPDK